MPEELHLVTELAIILIAAATFTIISKALKQPAILGYILAGFIVGPKLGLFPQFSAGEIHQWSELGIIFLLFGLGLEFSFKKLIKIGSSALTVAAVKCIGMFFVGYVTGHILRWQPMECIFLGGMLGMSSTTIIIKAYDDMGLKNKPYASLVFGSLVFEDLIAVLLLVLLSTIAVTGKFSGPEMVGAIMKLSFFLILWFLIGIYLIPLILRKARRFLNDEIMLLVSVGLCFLMVVLANFAGFSSALGAFVMGSILAETMEGEKILGITANIKDLFGAIFFVSVGMMIDPAIIAQYWLTILLITLVVIGGILIFSTMGVILSGKGLDTAVHASCSLAQLGEFAYIITGLGCSLGVMRSHIYPIIIAVSVITTFTTPYLIKLGDPASAWLRKRLPKKILDHIDPPQTAQTAPSMAEKSEWGHYLKSYILRIMLYGVLIVGILIGAGKFLPKIVDSKFLDCVITVLLMLPFLSGIFRNSTKEADFGHHLLKKNPLNRWPLLALILLKQSVIIAFVIAAINAYYVITWWIILIAIVAAMGFFFLSRYSFRHFRNLEDTFLGNLNEKEEQKRREAPVTASINRAMAGSDVRLKRFTISQDFEYIGKTLREMPFRHRSGANIIKIQRGNRSITIPAGNEVIMPSDVLLVVGTDEQLERFESVLSESTVKPLGSEEEFTVIRTEVTGDSIFASRSLRELDMRKSSCMVVSILHNGKQITNPDAEMRIEVGDSVWIAGEKSAVEWYGTI